MFKNIVISVAAMVVALTAVFGVQVALAAVHPAGSVVLDRDGTIYLINYLGQRRGFPTPEVFHAHGYKFSQVVPATAEDLALPVGPVMSFPAGALVKPSNDPTVYLITNTGKKGFTSADALLSSGYAFENVIVSSPVLLAGIVTEFPIGFSGSAVAGESTVANNAPTAPYISGPNVFSAHEVQNFHGHSVDSDGDVIVYTINWGDGSAVDTRRVGSGYNFFASHTWVASGEYTILVTATDTKGASRTTSYGVSVR